MLRRRWKLLVPLALAAGVLVASAVALALFQPRAGLDRFSREPASPEGVSLGAQVYQQNCAVCHGSRLEGQPNWRLRAPDGRYPPPPHDSSGHTWHHSDGLLFRIVKKGGASLNLPGLNSGMPAFGERLTDEEVRDVINYLKTWWGVEEREFQRRASEQDPFPVAEYAP